MVTLIVYAFAVIVSAAVGAGLYQAGYRQGLRHGVTCAEASAYALAMRDARALVSLGTLGSLASTSDRGPQ